MTGLFKVVALRDSLAPVFRVATQDQRGPIFNARVYPEVSVGPRPHLFSPGGLDSQGRPDGALWRFHSGQWRELGGKEPDLKLVDRPRGVLIPWVCNNLGRFAMPWNEADRVKYDVIRHRYSTDMSDEEFELVSALLPAAQGEGTQADRLPHHPQRACST